MQLHNGFMMTSDHGGCITDTSVTVLLDRLGLTAVCLVRNLTTEII